MSADLTQNMVDAMRPENETVAPPVIPAPIVPQNSSTDGEPSSYPSFLSEPLESDTDDESDLPSAPILPKSVLSEHSAVTENQWANSADTIVAPVIPTQDFSNQTYLPM